MLWRRFKSYAGSIGEIFSSSRDVRTVILGHQKSGTTVIGNLLSIYSGYSYSNDPLYRIDLGMGESARMLLTGQTTLEEIVQRNRVKFSAKIIKEPDFIFIIDQVFEVYPDAKFVYIVRDPRDNIRSILNRLDLIPGRMNERKPVNMHWEMILNGELPLLHGRSNEDFILNLSRRWTLAGKNYIKSSEKIHLLRYEDFLGDKIGEIKSIARKLEMDQVGAIDGSVNTQYQPKGESNVNLCDFFGRKNLDLIHNECGELMGYFGYE